MRTFWLAAAVAATGVLALSACNDAPDPAAKPGAPATIATTNAKVEPVPTETAKPTAAPKPAASETAEDSCGALKVAQFVGRQDRPTTRADLVKAVGHDRIRWIGPDDAVTMDFSPDRLNVLLDATKRLITGTRCG